MAQFEPYLHFDGNCAGALHFYALPAGGNVTMPYEKTFRADGFGMCTDRFGVPWMADASDAGSANRK